MSRRRINKVVDLHERSSSSSTVGSPVRASRGQRHSTKLLQQLAAVAALTLIAAVASAQTREPVLQDLRLRGIPEAVKSAGPLTVHAQTPTPDPQALVPDDDSLRHRLTVSALWGPDNSISGDVITNGSGFYQSTIPINFDDTSYDDIYGRMSLFKVGVGYRTSPRTEAVVNLAFGSSGSEVVQVGTVGDANAPLFADFDDYSYWGIEGGQRFYFARVRFTPYAGYIVGINRLSSIDATFTSTPVGTQPGVVLPDQVFFDSSWAFSFGPLGGVLVGLGPFEVMAEIGFRYMGGLSDVDVLSGVQNPLTGDDLREINSDSGRWSIPITFGARIRF